MAHWTEVLKELRVHKEKERTSLNEGMQEAKNHKCFASPQERRLRYKTLPCALIPNPLT